MTDRRLLLINMAVAIIAITLCLTALLVNR
jgi:hypothetical protein